MIMKKKIFFLILLTFFNSCNSTVDAHHEHHDEQKKIITSKNELALQKAKIFLKKLHLELDDNYSLEQITEKNIEDINEILIETFQFQLYLNGEDFKIRNFILNDFKVTSNTKHFENSELQKIAEELLNKLKISNEIDNFQNYRLDNLYMQDGIAYTIYTKEENLLILGFNPINNEIVLLTIR